MVNEKQKATDLNFEETLSRLEAIVSLMERGDVPLAQLVEQFEAGKQLLNTCQKHLKEAEFKLEELKKETEL